MIRTTWLASTAVLAVLFSASAHASTITIEFSGADFVFDGDDIADAGAPADDLDSVSISADSLDITLTSGISLDFVIPDVDDIMVGPGGIISDTVSTAAGGFLTLGLPGGDFISLDLDASTVTLVDAGSFSLTAVASVATSGTVSQSLPFGLVIDDPIDIVFSTFDVTGITTDAGVVTGFTATGGSGEITGASVIPEPSTIALACLFATTLCRLRRK